MRNFNIPSNLIFNLCSSMALVCFTACNPIKEKLQPKALVELEYVDPELVKQNSDSPDHAVVGNLAFELQNDMATNKTVLYASATFHEPISKNVLFDKIRTNALKKIEYKPKPAEQPCGIPGFPDCPHTTPDKPGGEDPHPHPGPSPVPPPGPPANPDEPCGIPGFPDCPTTRIINDNNVNGENI